MAARTPRSKPDVLDQILRTHCIDPEILRADKFDEFMKRRERNLLALIEKATGHKLVSDAAVEDMEQDVPADIARDSGVLAEAAE